MAEPSTPLVFGPESIEEIFRPLNAFERRHAPPQLFLRGDRSLLSLGSRVALVGSRRASEQGLARARRLGRILVENGVIIVSGLALGIDTMAHRTAIRQGGRTIAVLGTPLDDCHPRSNRELQETIGREHLLVSQFPEGSKVGRGNFPRRNRTMALLCDASVIVEAGDSSGTLSQGWEALRLGRPLFILDSVFRKGLEWPDEMVAYGATRLKEAEDLLSILPLDTQDPFSVAF